VRATGKDLGDSVPSVLSTFCHYQLFFPSEEAGRRWAQARGREDIVMLPVHQAFQLVRGWVERVFGAALEPR
jgi:Alkylmercury lyase